MVARGTTEGQAWTKVQNLTASVNLKLLGTWACAVHCHCPVWITTANAMAHRSQTRQNSGLDVNLMFTLSEWLSCFSESHTASAVNVHKRPLLVSTSNAIKWFDKLPGK